MRLRRVLGIGIGLAVLITTAAWTRPADPHPIEVVGGVRADADAYPWMVHLSTGCGGSLVKPDFVLTAAHCVPGSATGIVVTAGSTDLYASGNATVRGSAVVRADGFRDVTHGDDWAVIRLRTPLSLPTIALPTGTGGDRGPFTILGWGTTSEGSTTGQRFLREARVRAVADDTCGTAYRKAGYPFVATDMLCAGDPHGGVDTCQGDSGGPMVAKSGDGYVQVGIVSWGSGCARRRYPGVYTQVSYFANAIRAAITNLS